MSELTVILSPAGPALGVVAGLTDLTAAGLVGEFAWLHCPEDRRTPRTVTLVEHGRATEISVEQLVTGRQITLLRTCTLVPAVSGADPIAVADEVAAVNALSALTGAARVSRIRALLIGSEGAGEDLRRVIIEGWHNIVVSPEDSRAPGFGRIATPPKPGAHEFARFAAPVVAGLAGLWRDVDQGPLDGLDPLPGPVVRLARSYFRELRTFEVEQKLRGEILTQNGNLPLPSDPHSQIVPVQDPTLAAMAMCQALWRKHPQVLRGAPMAYEDHAVTRLGAWAALKMFFGFLWASLKNAPASWYRSVTDRVAGRIAAGVHTAVFTDAPAAYEVVVLGRRANGEQAGWADITAATDQLSGLAFGVEQVQNAQTDLSELWRDYANAALTLADAGSRGGNAAGLPPIAVGAAHGIIADAGAIVPGPDDRFNAIPGIVAAAVRMDGVDATDPLDIHFLRGRLAALQANADVGLAASSTLSELDNWAHHNRGSFGYLVGNSIATSFLAGLQDVQRLLEKLRNFQLPPEPGSSNLALARWTQVLVALWVVVTGVFIYLGVAGKVDWWVPVVVILGTLLLILTCLALAFIRSQRDLFALLHRRKKIFSDHAIDRQNLQTAMADVRRLGQAYPQFLSWSRVLGAFLKAPLGPDRSTHTAPLDIEWGMPMSTAVGTAQPAEEQITEVAGYLSSGLFHTGWLTTSWQNLILRTIPPRPGQDPSVAASPLWRDRGAGSQSSLDRWSNDMFAGRATSSGAEVVWSKAIELLSTSMAPLMQRLIGSVQVVGGPVQPVGEFLGGLDRQGGPRGTFATEVLTDDAAASGLPEVLVDHPRRVRVGLGITCVVTQLSDGFATDQLRTEHARADLRWTDPGLRAPDARPSSPSAAPPSSDYRPGGYQAPDLNPGFDF